jgi:gluconokinase
VKERSEAHAETAINRSRPDKAMAAKVVKSLTATDSSGKTTIGKVLAEALGWTFVEADEFHPAVNVEKMRQGIPLNDEDRKPWLAALRQRMDEGMDRGENIVLACSALKHAYQEYLDQLDPPHIHFVYLHGSEELIRERLAKRKGHFMNPNLLHSQFETLEPPAYAIRVEITASPETIADEIRRKFGL